MFDSIRSLLGLGQSAPATQLSYETSEFTAECAASPDADDVAVDLTLERLGKKHQISRPRLVDGELLGTLSQIVAPAARVLFESGKHSRPGGTYLVRFPRQIGEGLRNGVFGLMNSDSKHLAVAVNARTGRIAGHAAAGTDVCPCSVDVDCKAQEDGAACNGTLYCDKSGLLNKCTVSPATVVACIEQGAPPCSVSACQKATGKCAVVAANAGKACTDDNVCSAGDLCKAGKCVSGGTGKLWNAVDDQGSGWFNGVALLLDGTMAAVGARPSTTSDPNESTGLINWPGAVLVHLDVTGKKLGEAVRGGSETDIAQRAVHVPGGGWRVAGYTTSQGAGGTDGWLIRVTETLSPVWDRTYGGKGDDVLLDVARTADGGFVAVGYTASFGAADQQAWLQRTDPWGHATCTEAGKCGTLAADACDDGNPCTADDCEAVLGCTHLKLPDQAPCGGGKGCVSGQCQ